MNQDLRVLIVEDQEDFRRQTALSLRPYNEVYEAGSLTKAREIIRNRQLDVAILDKELPDGEAFQILPELFETHPNCAVLILTGDSDQNVVRKYIAAGAHDYVQKTENAILDLKIRIPTALAALAQKRKSRTLEQLLAQSFRYDIVGHSESTQKLRERILQLRGSHSPVLITGETGTGKELVARMLHKNEGSGRTFVSVNCGAIPENLIESELFGHKRGSFTGAVSDQVGKFELANGGDILLDEIGDLPLAAQVKLLRVLQEGEYHRVGDAHARPVNVRVMAATHKNLLQAVRDGKFRSDLYYRLNVIPIEIAPLRERREDIEPISKFLCTILGKGRYSLDAQVFRVLTAQPWLGNVRELKNSIERAMIEAQIRGSQVIEMRDLSFLLQAGPDSPETASFFPTELKHVSLSGLNQYIAQAEKSYLAKALSFFDGNAEALSVHMGLSRSALFRRLSEVGLTRRRLNAQSPGLTTAKDKNQDQTDVKTSHY